MKSLRRWVAGLAVLALVPALAACGSDDDGGSATAAGAQAPAKVVIGTTRDPQHSVQISVAEALGYFRDEGVDVTVKRFPTGPEVSQAVAAGDVQFFSGTAIPQWTLIGAGADIEILSQLGESSNAQGLVARDGIRTPKDLEGKKVALIPATSLEAFWQAVVEDYGIDADEVTTGHARRPRHADGAGEGRRRRRLPLHAVDGQRQQSRRPRAADRHQIVRPSARRASASSTASTPSSSATEATRRTTRDGARVLRAIAQSAGRDRGRSSAGGRDHERRAESRPGRRPPDAGGQQIPADARRPARIRLHDRRQFLEQAGESRDLPPVSDWLDQAAADRAAARR